MMKIGYCSTCSLFYELQSIIGTLTDKAENLNKLKLDASDQGKVPYNPQTSSEVLHIPYHRAAYVLKIRE